MTSCSNSESWSRATQSWLPQRAILASLVRSSATEGKFSHGTDGHVQGVNGRVHGVPPGVQGIPARLEGGVQSCCIQTRGLHDAARPAELETSRKTNFKYSKLKVQNNNQGFRFYLLDFWCRQPSASPKVRRQQRVSHHPSAK